MLTTQGLSEEKQALLEKYLRRSTFSPTTLSQVKHSSETALSISTEIKTDPRANITPIQVQGTQRPFFFLHGDWTDNAFFCFSLARALGPDQPFYALDPYKFDGLLTPPSVEDTAAAHITSLRAYQPEGPYRLGGFCNGGLIAYEMARQLQMQGQETEVLVLIDPIPARTTFICNAISALAKVMHLSKEQELSWFLRIRHIYKFIQLSSQRRYEDRELLRKIDPRLEKISAPTSLLQQDYPGMFTWATAKYVPSFYSGKVTLFWEEAEPFRKAWWNSMTQGKDAHVEEHVLQGNHITCRTDHLTSMADHLSTCLNFL